MKVDKSLSMYSEIPEPRKEFDRQEVKHCRMLLRRLQFLEQKIRESGGMVNGGTDGGAAFTEWESEALEWALTDIGFLQVDESKRPE